MKRAICGYHVDDPGDWVAELTCGHGQHVRHKPPLFLRPWVTHPEGRASMLGTELECVRCDRFEVPEGFTVYKRTPEFDERSLPAGLRKNHATRAGVWGMIRVLEGRLTYTLEAAQTPETVLDSEHPGVVVPEVLHHVAPDGPVRFFVEFLRAPSPVVT